LRISRPPQGFAFGEYLWPTGFMNRPIDTSAAKQSPISCIHNGIDVLLANVPD
jgi:hypothetical protein